MEAEIHNEEKRGLGKKNGILQHDSQSLLYYFRITASGTELR